MAYVANPFLVEITGVAGAGKSTLTQLVSEGIPDSTIAEFIHTRTPGHLGYVAHSVPRLAPILAGNLVKAPRLSWPDFKLLVYVSEWHRFLDRRHVYRSGITLFDQGPIYALVRLKAQARGVTRAASFGRWWNAELERWAGELAELIYLDAPDEVLWSRINGRAQPHRTKGGSQEVGREFITRYRELFEEVLTRLDVPGGPEIVSYDTSATSGEGIVAEVVPLLTARAKQRDVERQELP
jgi:deoxyadenosine/deoxycytidine kinase